MIYTIGGKLIEIINTKQKRTPIVIKIIDYNESYNRYLEFDYENCYNLINELKNKLNEND